MSSWVVIGIGGGAGLLALFLLVRQYLYIKKLNGSIAKLGYVIREDAKKYFDEAAKTITETNESFRSSSIEIITEASKRSLASSSDITEQVLARAHEESGRIIVSAREDARRIVDTAQAQAEENYSKVIEQSSGAIRWVLEQYVGQSMSAEQHEDIVKRLLDDYVNENRR